MPARLVERCDVCGSAGLELVLSLGGSPATCDMSRIGERRPYGYTFPLDVMWCDACKLAQSRVAVNPAIVFPDGYPYSSGNSGALHANFADLAERTVGRLGGFGPRSLLVDVGANDGTLLSKFGDCRKVAVDPTGQVGKADAHQVQAFFGLSVAEGIVATHGRADIVTATNVLAHCDDVHDFLAGVNALLAPDGLFVAENHDLVSITDGMQWDAVDHEHRRYWSRLAFRKALREHGLGVVEWRDVPTHGGSFRATCVKGVEADESFQPAPRPDFDFKRLRACAGRSRRQIREACDGVWAVGATARATTLISYCGLDADDIVAVAELPGSDKIGRFIPGTSIPVVDESELFAADPYRTMLLSWHMADAIAPKLRNGGLEGELVAPLPTLRGCR